MLSVLPLTVKPCYNHLIRSMLCAFLFVCFFDN